ncbi:MAG: hypothetical protein U0Y68_20280 [Blastocatellia bacterium]
MKPLRPDSRARLTIRPLNPTNFDALKNAMQNDASLNVRIVAMNGL